MLSGQHQSVTAPALAVAERPLLSAAARRVPQSFYVETHEEPDAFRVAPVGELDISTVDLVDMKLVEACEAGVKNLVLDLRQLSFMDSSGLHLARRWADTTAAMGVTFTIIDGPPQVQRVFRILATHHLLPIGEQ